jgi:NADH-quinone oxidoreductase subunit K
VVPLSWYVVLGGAVFCIGILGFLTRRNVIIMLMSIELMLNGVNITLVAFNHYLQDMRGQILALFIITVAGSDSLSSSPCSRTSRPSTSTSSTS